MDDVRYELQLMDENIILFDDLDEAVIGYMYNENYNPVAVYDYDKCIEVFQEQGMTEDEAIDWMEVNVVPLYVGEYTPKIMYRLMEV